MKTLKEKIKGVLREEIGSDYNNRAYVNLFCEAEDYAEIAQARIDGIKSEQNYSDEIIIRNVLKIIIDSSNPLYKDIDIMAEEIVNELQKNGFTLMQDTVNYDKLVKKAETVNEESKNLRAKLKSLFLGSHYGEKEGAEY